jgi:hypothetical protein
LKEVNKKIRSESAESPRKEKKLNSPKFLAPNWMNMRMTYKNDDIKTMRIDLKDEFSKNEFQEGSKAH